MSPSLLGSYKLSRAPRCTCISCLCFVHLPLTQVRGDMKSFGRRKQSCCARPASQPNGFQGAFVNMSSCTRNIERDSRLSPSLLMSENNPSTQLCPSLFTLYMISSRSGATLVLENCSRVGLGMAAAVDSKTSLRLWLPAVTQGLWPH